MKLPAFQFYPGDWQKDLNLRRCTHAAKGVWMDMLCLMFESEERGVLITGGSPWSEKDVAVAVGGNLDVTLLCIRELLDKGVARKREDGAIYSSRMVKDEENRKSNNERLKRHRKQKRNGECNADETVSETLLKRQCTEDEVEVEEEVPPEGESEGGLLIRVPTTQQLAEEIYQLYPRKVDKPAALRAIIKALKEHPSDYLREKTIAYAYAVRGTDTLLPNPATWFNGQRYNDDPETWARVVNNGQAKPRRPMGNGL